MVVAARREEDQGESGGIRIPSMSASIVPNRPILYSTEYVGDGTFVLAGARVRARG